VQLYELQLAAIAAAPPIAGDFNHDGAGDAADYVVWRNGFGTMYTQGDFNNWRANFGETLGSGSGSDVTGSASSPAAPEPSTALLLLSAAAGVYLRQSLQRAGGFESARRLR
jgi:hypothetical protein